MKKSHRIAFIKEAIKLIEQHTPCLESYVRDNFAKYVRKCKHLNKEVNLDKFYDGMPARYRVLRSDGQTGLPYDAELLEELEEDLEALEPSKKIKASMDSNPDKKTTK